MSRILFFSLRVVQIFPHTRTQKREILFSCTDSSLFSPQTGSTLAPRNASPLPWLAAANARSGLIRTKSTRFQPPTLAKPSASLSAMALSSANLSPCTHAQGHGSWLLLARSADIEDLVRERVQRMPECQGTRNRVSVLVEEAVIFPSRQSIALWKECILHNLEPSC